MAAEFDPSVTPFYAYIEVASLGIIPTAVPLTIAVWFDPDTAATSSDECLVSIADSASGNNWFELQYINNAVYASTRDAGANVNGTTSNTISVGTGWHHACAIFDTDSRIAVLDGDWASKGSDSTINVVPLSVDMMRIGYRADLNPNTPYDGKIGYVAIWAAALTERDVNMLQFADATLVRPDALVFKDYLRDRAIVPIYDTIGGATGTETGTINTISGDLVTLIQPSSQILHLPERRLDVSGTVTASIDEADIVTGSKTIVLDLHNNQWVSS